MVKSVRCINKMVKYKTRIRRIISKLRTHKPVAIIAVILFIIVVLSMGGLMLSQRAWNNYETSYSKNIYNAKVDIDSVIINTLSDTGMTSISKINDLSLLQTKLSKDVGTYCKVDDIIGWQSFIKQLSDTVNVCQKRKENMLQLLDKIGNMAAYLKAEQSLSTIISKVIVKTDQNNQADKWNKVEAYWRQAVVDISGLDNTYLFSATKAVAVSSLSGIADSWQRISSANDVKDRQKFEIERTDLDKSYAGLAAVSDTSKEQMDKMIAEFNVSYEKINN